LKKVGIETDRVSPILLPDYRAEAVISSSLGRFI